MSTTSRPVGTYACPSRYTRLSNLATKSYSYSYMLCNMGLTRPCCPPSGRALILPEATIADESKCCQRIYHWICLEPKQIIVHPGLLCVIQGVYYHQGSTRKVFTLQPVAPSAVLTPLSLSTTRVRRLLGLLVYVGRLPG